MTTFSGFADTRLRVETVTDGEITRVVIHGEVDIANVNHLEAALTGIPLDRARSVYLDASDLEFFDVAALRRLIVFARLVKQAGRNITTCGAPPMLHDVARMLGLQDDLGLPRPGPILP
jgi:anti-anti-sigma factor